jgi:acetylornithine/N-succinyldiaminopimelate aminotransferase
MRSGNKMKIEDVFNSYKENIVPSYTKTALVFVKGKGSYLWDIHGKKYLDFFPGWGVGNLGHCHSAVMNAVRDQVSKLIFIPNNYYNLPQARLAKELKFWAGNDFKAFFCNSGAEATEASIKAARRSGNGRFEIITFENAFHGRTLAALAATGQEKYQQGFTPMPEGFKSVRFNDLAAVKNALTDRTVAVFLELIQGEGGINIADKEFVCGLRRLCDEKKLLLIIDEVQTGIGRTGTMFAWQQYGIVPDIFTLAKALGGGLPIGVMMARGAVADTLGPGSHASTFGGGPVVCKAALAVLTAVGKEKLLRNAEAMGRYLRDKLDALRQTYPVIKEVRGIGLMCGVQLSKPGKPLVEVCVNNGLLINCTHDTVLRVMPALNTTKQEIDKAIRLLEQSLKEAKL